MNVEEIRRRFRTPRAEDYPELRGYSREAIYEGKMGPGGLYLAAQTSRRLGLSHGQRVLDLGCGQGVSSVFLAKYYGVDVIAVDLWVSATDLYRRLEDHGVSRSVVPLNLDITKGLPFSHDYFNAIFRMDSIHYYGGSLEFWGRLLPHLKSGGQLSIGSPCFSAEFSPDALRNLPPEYDDGTELWSQEFSRYHSPPWWADLLDRTGLLSPNNS